MFFAQLWALHVEIIYEAHPWLASAFMISTNVIWGVRVYQSTRIAMDSTDYSLSYGQILSIFAAVTPVLYTIRLAWSSRDYLWHFLKRLPGEIMDEIIFVLTGHRDPLHKFILPATQCSSPAQSLLSCSSVSATTSPDIPASSTSNLPPPPPPARHRSSPFITGSQNSEPSAPIPWPSCSTGVLSTLSSPEVSSIRRRTSSVANISDNRSNDIQHRHRISTSTSAGASLPDGIGDSPDNSLQPIFAHGQLSESPPESPHATYSVADAISAPAHVVSSSPVDGQSEYFDARSTTSSDTVRLIQGPDPKAHSASEAPTHPTMTPFAYRSLTAPSTGKLSWSGARRRFLTDAEKRRA
ncbi:uncharacterized protein STEHIDRAFT_153294 [Stereum hirsutum FP-91666 SS1]|uniref:uncharacterized protein n=1 Tax=Stereum hirsutum (strain FP-91666) TaxID=721885 RepID=UPI000440C4A2|nr:uncharacterized protein STEHIDRAFT_153294 [Stereum hirsutum FP-91666 SS1]EIM91673.1 hypothetical protein STEHIDRAFT_153294 [Stereum hirsutum FP-91666 SS1]